MSKQRQQESAQTNSDDDEDFSEYFKDAETQVEEGDIVLDAVRTGVAETPLVVNYAQVFGTHACLNTEPQTTFVLPSMQSPLALRAIAETTLRSRDRTVVTSSVRFPTDSSRVSNLAFLNNPRSNSLHVSSLSSPSPPSVSLPYSSSLSSRPVFTRNASPDFRSKTVPKTQHQAPLVPQESQCGDVNTVVTSTSVGFPTASTRVSNLVFSNNPRSNSLHVSSLSSPSPPSVSLPYSSSLSFRPVFTRNASPDFRSKTVPKTQHQAQESQCISTHLSSHAGESTCLTNHNSLIAATRTVASNTQENIADSTSPKYVSAENVVSGVSGHPLCTPRSSVQSDIPVALTTFSCSPCGDSQTTKTTTTMEPGSELQTSDKFVLRVSRDNSMTSETTFGVDGRRIGNLECTSATRNSASDVAPSEKLDETGNEGSPPKIARIEEASTSRDYTQSDAHEQYRLQLTKQESASRSYQDQIDVVENPLTRRRASSAPSVGLGRLFRKALRNSGPELVDVGLPVKRSALERRNSAVQTEDGENERPKVACKSGKRRKSSIGTLNPQKRRKGVAFVEYEDDADSRLRDKLLQRIWDGTTFKVEEVNDIDFTETTLSRRGSRRESMGIIGDAHGYRRRQSTAVHNTIIEEDGQKPTESSSPDVVARQQQSSVEGKNEEISGETSSMASSSAEKESADFAGEPSHAQNEPMLESENSSRSKSEMEDDAEEDRDQYDMYS